MEMIHASHRSSVTNLKIPSPKGGLCILTLQIRRRRHREAELLVRSSTELASKQGWDSNPGNLDLIRS